MLVHVLVCRKLFVALGARTVARCLAGAMTTLDVANRFSWLSKKAETSRAERDFGQAETQRTSVTGASPESMLQRGWQIQRSRVKNTQNLGELQDIWKAEVPPPIDPVLEEALRLGHARLAKLTEVNRALHDSIVKKKLAVQNLESKGQDLQTRLEAAVKAQEPAQKIRLQELEDLLRNETTKYQEIHQELSQKNHECEEQVREMHDATRNLHDWNAANRKLIKEQAMEIRERQKAIKDLQRHVHLVEGAESAKDDSLKPFFLEDNSRLGAKKRVEEDTLSDVFDQADDDQELEDDSEVSGTPAQRTSEGVADADSMQPKDSRPPSCTPSRPVSGRPLIAGSVRGTAASYRRRLPGLNLEKLLGIQKSSPPTPVP